MLVNKYKIVIIKYGRKIIMLHGIRINDLLIFILL